MFPFTSTMIVHKSGGIDDYGDPLPTTDVTVSGVLVDPFGSSTEDTDRRNQTVSEVTIYDPSYCAIESSDTVTLNGKRYEVVGEPAQAHSPFTGWSPGQRIQLRRVTG